MILPASYPTRSLMNANSFSLDGSISANSGTRRNNSNSCFRLICLPPLSLRPRCSFRCREQCQQRILTRGKLGRGALLLQFAVAEDEGVVEVASEAGAMQHPNDAAAGEFLLEPPSNACLGPTVERRGRFVEDEQ